MRVTKQNTVYFDLNTLFDDRFNITQIGAVHAASGNSFNERTNSENIGKRLKKFVTWLKKVNDGKPVVLIGHNAFGFDAEVLEKVAKNNEVKIPARLVAGYEDSLQAFRSNYNYKKNDLTSLAKQFGLTRPTHDALQDSKLLKKLVNKALEDTGMNINQFFTE
jgi:DNA polymerase III epsilon subunit-like protein